MRRDQLRPAHFAYTYLAVEVALHFFFPIKNIFRFPYTLLGIPVLILALVINSWASALLIEKRTSFAPFEKPSALIEDGPFRHSRNPIYLSAVMSSMGLAILLGSLIVFPVPLVMLVTLDVVFVRYEERNLESIFGQEYVAYKKHVRRWL